jgi:hypothetical protein
MPLSQAMTTRLSSLDLDQGAAVTGGQLREDLGGNSMRSVSSAESDRIPPPEDGAERAQGVATSYEDMALPWVRTLGISARGDTFNRGETVVAQHDDYTPAY